MLTILLFLLWSVVYGYCILRIARQTSEDLFTDTILSFPVGLACFVFFASILSMVGSLTWYNFALASAILVIQAIRSQPLQLQLPKPTWSWLIIASLFAIHLYVFYTGAFSYPWLEDDDPWDHASAVRYISEFRTFTQPQPAHIHYLAPYPPFYDTIMAMLFQAGGTISGIMKSYNVLLISLCIPMSFLLFRELFGERPALFATFIITCIPSFMSHFIWAQSLAMLFLIAALYLSIRWLKRPTPNASRLTPLTLIMVAFALFVTQPSVAAIGGIMLCITILSWRLAESPSLSSIRLDDFSPIMSGFGIALLLFWIPMAGTYGIDGISRHTSASMSFVTDKTEDTGGGIVYGLTDLMDAPTTSRMDQPTGWGIGIFILVVFGSLLAMQDSKKPELATILLLFCFCLIGLEANLLPIKLMPHRFWVFLAIPAAALAGHALEYVYIRINDRASASIILVMILLIITFTSADAKWTLEGKSNWPPGVSFVSPIQLSGYINLSASLPASTKVFSYCSPENLANGFNMYGYQWSDEVYNYKYVSIVDTNTANYQFLTKYNYTYLIIDHSCLNRRTSDEIMSKLQMLSADPRFTLDDNRSQPAFLVFRVN